MLNEKDIKFIDVKITYNKNNNINISLFIRESNNSFNLKKIKKSLILYYFNYLMNFIIFK